MDILTVRHALPPGGTMDSAQSAVAKVIAAKRPKRRLRSAEEKKRIVEETMAKGASVARVAQAHGVHNQSDFMTGVRNIERGSSGQRGSAASIYCRWLFWDTIAPSRSSFFRPVGNGNSRRNTY